MAGTRSSSSETSLEVFIKALKEGDVETADRFAERHLWLYPVISGGFEFTDAELQRARKTLNQLSIGQELKALIVYDLELEAYESAHTQMLRRLAQELPKIADKFPVPPRPKALGL